jgi:hypothetical protein
VLTAACVASASVAVFGIEPWRVWAEWMLNPPAEAYQNWVRWGRLEGESLFTNLALLGVPQHAANLAQAAALFACAGCVWWCYRRPVAADLQLAVLLASTTLAAPHLGPYDAVLLVVAVTILFVRGIEEGFRIGEMPVLMGVWMIQLFNPPGAFRIGVITPFLTGLFLIYALTRARASFAIPAGPPAQWRRFFQVARTVQ